MTKKPTPNAYFAKGEHVGEGWVLIAEGAHPVISMYFRHSMVRVTEAETTPVGTRVRLAFEKNKNCLKRVGLHIVS